MIKNLYSITIGWLYPELMSTYGDRGNIITLTKRCEWNGIKAKVKKLDLGFNQHELLLCDLLFMGGAQDNQQKIVAEDLTKSKVETLSLVIDSAIPGLYICGAYQFLGKYYKEADGTIIKGLGIFDLYTENPGDTSQRLIGNMAFAPTIVMSEKTHTLIGFENHGGRTYLGKQIEPFGHVIKGYGNNGRDHTEGARYKNSFGTYCHGPILPKNPHFADYLIRIALAKKYNHEVALTQLNDTLEWNAHEAIAKRIGVSI